MENPKGGLVTHLKYKLDECRKEKKKLEEKFLNQRKENRILRKQLSEDGAK